MQYEVTKREEEWKKGKIHWKPIAIPEGTNSKNVLEMCKTG